MTNPVNERKVRCILHLRRGPISYVSWWARGTRTSMVRALHVAYWYGSPKSFHEKAGQSQDGFVFPFCGFLLFSRAASVAILPSAVFYERFSLAARWASSIQ